MQDLSELTTLCRKHGYGVNISFNPSGHRESSSTVAVSFFTLNPKRKDKLRSYDCKTGHDILSVAAAAWAGLHVPFEEYRGARIPKQQLDLDSLLSELDL